MPGLEEASILARYHRLQKQHYDQLAEANMSDELKRKLFGFSSVSFLINERNPKDLVLENHPLKGRIIMTKTKFEEQQI